MPESGPKLVRDLMTVGVDTCPPDALITDIARLILERDLEAVVVLQPADGHAIGFVGREELARAYAGDDWSALTAEEVMRVDLPQAPPDIPLTAAAQLMLDQGLRCLFLVHHSGGVIYPAGVITFKHLIRHLAMRDARDIQDLGIHAVRRAPLEDYYRRREEARRRNIKKDHAN